MVWTFDDLRRRFTKTQEHELVSAMIELGYDESMEVLKIATEIKLTGASPCKVFRNLQGLLSEISDMVAAGVEKGGDQ